MKDVAITTTLGHVVNIYPQCHNSTHILFEEEPDVTNGYFEVSFEDLMEALNSAGFPVRGWEPRKSLAEAKEDAVRKYLATKDPQVLAQEAAPTILSILKRVEEDYK